MLKKRRACNEIRCKQKDSYRSGTCSLSSLQNNGRMKILRIYFKTKTYLALALLVTVLASNAYGDDEVYYCAQTDNI